MNVAAVALITGVLLHLVRAGLVDWLTVAPAALALVVQLWWRVNAAWRVVGGALVGAAAHLVRPPL